MIQTVAADEPSGALTTEEQNDAVIALPSAKEQPNEEQLPDQVQEEGQGTNKEETEVEESEDTEELEAGANDAAPETTEGAAAIPIPAPLVATAPNQPTEDQRSDIERQPYEFDKCTVQIAIQLLPNDGDTNGRQVLVGVRSHQDAPILRLMRWNELGALPLTVMDMVEQLQSELPAREQAAKEWLEKEKEAQARRHTKASPAQKTKAAKVAKPVKPKTVQAAAAPAPSVLTDEQRTKAVSQVTVDDKRQPALF
jgi:hypothetical protein